MPPTGSTRPRRVISPVIASAGRTAPAGQQRHQRRRHASRRPTARPWGSRRPARGRGCPTSPRSRRAMPSSLGVRADPGQRRLRRLLHHVAELAGEGQRAACPASASPRRTGCRRRPASTPARWPRPGTRVRSSSSSNSKRGAPRNDVTSSGVIGDRLGRGPRRAARATLRQTLAISRSRLRTPASRV